MWDNRARIVRVKDGDTVVSYEDLGKHEFCLTDVRLFGTFAPERGQPGDTETADFARAWIAERTPTDSEAWPWTILYMRNKANTDEQTTFGRYVCMVRCEATGEYLNTAVSAFVLTNGYPRGTGG